MRREDRLALERQAADDVRRNAPPPPDVPEYNPAISPETGEPYSYSSPPEIPGLPHDYPPNPSPLPTAPYGNPNFRTATMRREDREAIERQDAEELRRALAAARTIREMYIEYPEAMSDHMGYLYTFTRPPPLLLEGRTVQSRGSDGLIYYPTGHDIPVQGAR